MLARYPCGSVAKLGADPRISRMAAFVPGGELEERRHQPGEADRAGIPAKTARASAPVALLRDR